jgi:hypothetical protein
MKDEKEPFRLYDNKDRAFVNQKEYASQSSASKVAERKNQEYGSHRYSAEKYNNIVQRNTPKTGGSGKSTPFNSEGGMKPGQSPSLGNPIQMAKGGMTASRRADGCATKGKTKGRFV